MLTCRQRNITVEDLVEYDVLLESQREAMTNDEARELATIANEAADETAAIVRKVAEQRAAIVQRMAEEMAAIVHRADEERAAIVQKVADKARQLTKAHTSRTPTAEGKKYLTEFEHR